ncbi:MAG: hypothetical protein QGG39_07355 [Candidatus Poribacteria bacterium]|jgi:hypothetical protein|nr:hypothetical protein [Candidatus Poribacteria bacterium]
MPIIGAVDLALAQQCPLKIAKLVKTEPGMVTGAAKVPVVDPTFLSTIGLTDRTIQIQKQLANRFAFLKVINPFSR